MALTTKFRFGGMDNVNDPANVGAPDSATRDRFYSQCVDIVNCDVDNDSNVLRRPGRILTTPGSFTSGWSNGTVAYCVSNSALNTFNGTQATPIGNSPVMLPTVEFCEVNDIVVFSDNNTIGGIVSGVPYVFSNPREATEILDLETWVKFTYPVGEESRESNIEIDAFNLSTFAGRCLTFYNGALYFAVDNFVFCTKTFNVEKMDIRRNVVAGFNSPVTLIKAVNGGLFVGTGKGLYFLAGAGVARPDENALSVSKGFTQEKILPFGVVYGSGVMADAAKVKPLGTANLATVFLTTEGVYAAGEGGKVINLTDNKMTMPSGSTSAAVLRQLGETWQYIVSVNTGAVVVNLATGAHSRYISYDFNSLFFYNGRHYGANSSGIFSLLGEKDAGVDIEAYPLTPQADFGVSQQKRCNYAYLYGRVEKGMVLDIFIGDKTIAEGLPFISYLESNTDAGNFRARLPRGAVGNNWQFKIRNVDGGDFTLISLEVVPAVLHRFT